jgi:hypothetical protein
MCPPYALVSTFLASLVQPAQQEGKTQGYVNTDPQAPSGVTLRGVGISGGPTNDGLTRRGLSRGSRATTVWSVCSCTMAKWDSQFGSVARQLHGAARGKGGIFRGNMISPIGTTCKSSTCQIGNSGFRARDALTSARHAPTRAVSPMIRTGYTDPLHGTQPSPSRLPSGAAYLAETPLGEPGRGKLNGRSRVVRLRLTTCVCRHIVPSSPGPGFCTGQGDR